MVECSLGVEVQESFCNNKPHARNTALSAIDSRAEPSPTARNNRASSDTNCLPTEPRGTSKLFFSHRRPLGKQNPRVDRRQRSQQGTSGSERGLLAETLATSHYLMETSLVEMSTLFPVGKHLMTYRR